MLTLALIAAFFLVLERLLPSRKQAVLRPRLGTDLLFLAGQQLVFGTIALGLLTAVQRLVGGWLPRFEAPLAAQLALALLLGDLCLYWFHRACHHFTFLWRIHQVHHSSEHLDWAAAYREHPLDGVLTQLVLNLPAMMLGVPLGALAGLAIFRGLWAIFIHSNVEVPLGPLLYVFGAPRLHHWHHAKTPARVANFGNLSPWTDLLFGTFELPERGAAYALGVPEPLPRSWPGLLLHPFRGASAALTLGVLCVATAFTSFADDGGSDAGAADGGLSTLFGTPQFLPASKSFGAAPGDALGFGGLGLRGSGGGSGGLGIGALAQPAKTELADPVVMGSLDKELIRRVIRSHLGLVRACSITDAGVGSGQVVVKFVISPEGSVSSASVTSSTTNDGALDACVANAVKTMVFPKPKGGGRVIVNYPFKFTPATAAPR